jgi:hypothetical protein
MQTKFTRGPWRIEWACQTLPYQIVGAEGERVTRWGAFIKPSQPTGVANAHLIAAAPELYEALVRFIEDPTFQVAVGGNPNVVDRMLDHARAALAKARGEQP